MTVTSAQAWPRAWARTGRLSDERWDNRVDHGSLGRVSYVYICGALLTTWNIVFNLYLLDNLHQAIDFLFSY